MADLKALFYRAAASALDNRGKPAQLARTDGTLYFTDDSGVTHYDRGWARVGEGDSRQETVVYLDKVAAQRDLPVRVDLVNGVDTVIGIDRARAVEFAGGSTSTTPLQFNLPSHTHARLGPMPDYIEGLRFLPLQAHPTSPPSMAVTVEQGSYRYGSADEIWQTADSADLSAYIPGTATVKHFIILCLDRSTGALAVVDGDDITAAGGDALFGTGTLTADDVQTILDAGINDAYWPLAAILFYNGQTTIKAKDIIFDLRPWGGEGGSGGSPGGSDTQVQFNNAGVFGGDAGLTYDAANDVLNVGAGITVGTTGAPLAGQFMASAAVPGIFFEETDATDNNLFIALNGGEALFQNRNDAGVFVTTPVRFLMTAPHLSLDLDANGQLALATQGSTGGVLIGGDVQLYRSAAGILTIPDAVIIDGSADTEQLHVQGNATQNDPVVLVEQSDGTDILTLANAGQLALPVQGSGGGLLIGGDVQLYRSNASELTIPDGVIVTGTFRVQASSPVFQFINTGATDRNIAFDLTSSTFAIAQYTDALTLVGNRLQISMLASNLVLDAGQTELVLNQAGDDYDFRVEGVGQANGLVYDAANNRLGILTGSPAATLDVAGLTKTANLLLDDNTAFPKIEISRGGADLGVNFDWDFPNLSTAAANVRIMRNTNTSGGKTVTIFRGNGTSTSDHTFTAGGGYQVGAATGGDKGVGTINVSGNVYKNNVAYTSPDYALEHWATGKIEKYKANEGAADYRRMSLDEVEQYIRQHYHLPRISREPAGIFDMADMALEKIEELFTYVIELHHRLKELET